MDEDPVSPTAPPPPLPVKDMDNIEGYQKFVQPAVAYVPPPPSYATATAQSAPPPTPERFGSRLQLSQEEARACLVGLAKSQCCWSTSAAMQMTFNNIQHSTAVQYTLRTFVESRSTDWTYEPYMGQPIDGPAQGAPPQPWQIEVPTPQWFLDQTINLPVPRTSSVKLCHNCQGNMRILCRLCYGVGMRRCFRCSGAGFTQYEQRRPCSSCFGMGRRACTSCGGLGRVPCRVCSATGRLRCFINLAIQYKTHVSDFILERTPLPDHLIRNVEGAETYQDTQYKVTPIRTFPLPELNQQSEFLIHQHSKLSQSGRIWRQQHSIREVPVFQCDCTYKGSPLQFFVFGFDKMVFVQNYPQQCCCGCQLL